MKRAYALIAMLAATGCQAMPLGWAPGMPLGGNWGGTHVGLALDATGGRLDYDCASGEILGPVQPDRAGRFVAQGFHTPGQGGPVRVDYVPPRRPATYSGQVSGDSMSLTVRVADGALIGPMTLRRGAQPMLYRCL